MVPLISYTHYTLVQRDNQGYNGYKFHKNLVWELSCDLFLHEANQSVIHKFLHYIRRFFKSHRILE